MEHVLWIGGPPRSGKTTVASLVARRRGFRLYSADTHTWIHRDRALAVGHEAAQRWEAMTDRERWVEASTSEMIDMSLHHERGQMVLDDLAELPASPPVVAEGSPLSVAAFLDSGLRRTAGVWLLPTARFQDAALRAARVTGGRARLYRRLRDLIIDEVTTAQLPSIEIDGSASPGEVVTRLEGLFGDVVVADHHSRTHRRSLLREANLAIVDQVRAGHRRVWSSGDSEAQVRVFHCECGDRLCDKMVAVPVGEAAGRGVGAPGHSVT